MAKAKKGATKKSAKPVSGKKAGDVKGGGLATIVGTKR
jgi:hypothetical protein